MARLSTEDMIDLLPLFLVVKLAENPELDEVGAAKAICTVIDRHVEEATR